MISRIKIICLLFTLVIMLQGCATLGKDECLNAHWQSIGYEDGGKGYKASRIGDHRKACSKFNVVPNFEDYTAGHRQGIVEWCTPRNGYNQGTRGRQYNGVCPENLEADFVFALEQGREVYEFDKEIQRYEKEIDKHYTDLDGIEEDIKYMEAELISDGISSNRRRYLLDQIRRAQRDHYLLEDEISELKYTLRRMRKNLDELKEQSPYN